MTRTGIEELIDMLQLVVSILHQPNTDVVWSHYNSAKEAVADFEQHIERLRRGDLSVEMTCGAVRVRERHTNNRG